VKDARWRDLLAGLSNEKAVFVAGCMAEPTGFLNVLALDPDPLANRRIVTSMVPGINHCDPTAGAPGGLAQTIFPLSGCDPRRQVLLPMHYSSFWRWLGEGAEIGAVLCQVAPAKGGYTLGLTADFVPRLLALGLPAIVQVNPNLPSLPKAPVYPASTFAALVELESPLIIHETGEPDPVFAAIGAHIASIIQNGDALQLGLGKVQSGVLNALRDAPISLRLHGGMISGPALPLLKHGQVNRADVGVIVGTEALYKDVPYLEQVTLRTVEETHGAAALAGVGPFVSVNSAISVDLSGQATAESLGGRTVSALGGLGDFHRAALATDQGRAVLALPSTARGKSRIVPALDAGSRVSVSAQDAGIVITEYGIADLRGKDADARAKALIAIAEPEHRDALQATLTG